MTAIVIQARHTGGVEDGSKAMARTPTGLVAATILKNQRSPASCWRSFIRFCSFVAPSSPNRGEIRQPRALSPGMESSMIQKPQRGEIPECTDYR